MILNIEKSPWDAPKKSGITFFRKLRKLFLCKTFPNVKTLRIFAARKDEQEKIK